MNARERYLAALTFGEPDRIPLSPGGGRESTRERWYAEGLPREVANIAEYAYRQAGGTAEWPAGGPQFRVNERLIPEFEEKVLERRERSQIVQDWKGNVCEIGNEFDITYLRNAIDFVTRRWIRCPVEGRDDWPGMKARYDAEDPARLPENAAEVAAGLRDRDYPITLHFSGPFWIMREWCGFEGLCYLMHDDPAFVEEMAQFWTEFVARLLERALAHLTPDMVHLSEDMAYKSFSMVSPEMARRFLLPSWRRWGEIVHGAGVPLYAMDSDGFIGQLIPLWIEAGINVCDPIEVAAGNDLPAFRQEFGQDMAFQGGVDKRCIAKGGSDLERELARLTPVVRGGGYIPGCDHGVPSDVSWPNYVRYVGLLARLTGWL